MPTFIPIYTFVAGAVTDADQYCENLYSPGNAASFSSLNGNLDQLNWPLLTAIPKYFGKEDIQRGALSGGKGRSGTANLDYFNDWFQGFIEAPNPDDGDQVCPAPTGTDDLVRRYMPIPGGTITFELTDRASDVIVTWTVLWGNDSAAHFRHSYLRLFVDGEPIPDQVRQAPRNIAAAGPLPFTTHPQPQTLERSRYWSGHHALTDMQRGEHTVSLRLLAHENVPQTRIWARSMRYFRFMQAP